MKQITQKMQNKLVGLENYGKFLHKETNKVFVAPTEELMQIEYNNKKWLYQLPKETEIKCFEYDEETGVSSTQNIFQLKELRIITSISYNDFSEIFYSEK